jgi:membrane protease YdiL (CAAX protease family)
MSVAGKSAVFLALSFALSWSVLGGAVAMGWTGTSTLAIAALAAMMFGPSVAALICVFAFEKGRRREALGLKFGVNWWWLWAWVLALAIAFGSVFVTVGAGQAELVDLGANYIAQARVATPEHAAALDQAAQIPGLSWIILAQAVLLGTVINTIVLTLSEELGWRGYLYDLWRRFGFVRCSLATGLVWGLWHAPAIYLVGLNYPEHRLIGIPLFVVMCVLLAFSFTLVRDRGGSVIAAGVLHGTFNAVGPVAGLLLSTNAFPWNGVVGIGGFAVCALAAAGAWALARPGPQAAPSPQM